MGCLVTFYLKKKAITYESKYNSEDELTIENIVNEVLSRGDTIKYKINGGEWELGNLMVALHSLISSKDVSSHNQFAKNVHKIINGEIDGELVGNYTLKDLTLKYPSLNFKNLEEVLEPDEEIIYIPGLKYDDKGLGGVVTIHGRTYHFLTNYFEVKGFLYNLHIRNKLKQYKENPSEFDKFVENNSNLRKAINFIKDSKGISNNYTAVEYFFKHSNEFLYKYVDDVDIYSTMATYLSNLVYDRAGNKLLSNPVLNSIYQRATPKSHFNQTILLKDIKKICLMIENDTSNELLEAIKSKDNDKIKYLLEELFSNEDLNVGVIISDGIVYFNRPFVSFEDVGFNEQRLNLGIKKLSKFGLNCFEFWSDGKPKYYVSTENILTLDSYADNRFDSLEEAENYINNRIKKLSIFKLFKVEKYNLNPAQRLNFRTTTKYFSPRKNSSFDVYDYNIPTTSYWISLISDEYRSYIYDNIEDGIEKLKQKFNTNDDLRIGVDRFEFSKVITDYDKFVILLLELSGGNTINGAIQIVKQLKTTRYLVIDKNIFGDHINLKLSEVHPGVYYSEDYDKYEVPTIVYLKNLADLINRKFKLKTGSKNNIIEIVTNDDLKKRSNVKGYIENGVIKINASVAKPDTLIHEFSHLFLGMLKATNMDGYLKLLDLARKNENIISIIEDLKKDIIYANLAEPDLLEEAFARLYGLHILHNPDKLNLFENSVNSEILKAVSAFNTNIETASTLQDLFENFGTVLFSTLSLSNGLELNLEAVKSRRVTNLMKEKISKREIIENCP